MSCVTPPVPTQRRGRGRDHGWGTLHVTRSTRHSGKNRFRGLARCLAAGMRTLWRTSSVNTADACSVRSIPHPSSWRRFTPQLATLGRAAESHIAMSGHQTFVKHSSNIRQTFVQHPPARAPIPAATVTHCEARLQHCSGDTTQSAAGGQIETLVTLRHREGIC